MQKGIDNSEKVLYNRFTKTGREPEKKKEKRKMKKIISLVLALTMLCGAAFTLASCGGNKEIIVRTNAYFAPFEYYDGTEIVAAGGPSVDDGVIQGSMNYYVQGVTQVN